MPGFYSFRLDADTGGQRYITLAVKSGDAHGKIVLLNGDTTWQAYNVFGGYSLYLGPNGAFADPGAGGDLRPSLRRQRGRPGRQRVPWSNLLPLLALVEGARPTPRST